MSLLGADPSKWTTVDNCMGTAASTPTCHAMLGPGTVGDLRVEQETGLTGAVPSGTLGGLQLEKQQSHLPQEASSG